MSGTEDALTLSVNGQLYQGWSAIETDVGGPFADATIERDETAYEFFERLCRLRGVLMTDDAQGRLVLTNTGTARAAGRLVQGQNIYAARASLSWVRRFSIYVVKGQHAIDSFNPAEVQTALVASAVDPAVTRFRPRVSIAESQLDAEVKNNVELLMPYGFTAMPDAGDVLLVSVGGVRDHQVALGADNTALRIADAKATELGHRDVRGQQIVLRVDRIEITSPLKVVVTAPQVLIAASGQTAAPISLGSLVDWCATHTHMNSNGNSGTPNNPPGASFKTTTLLGA